MERDASPPPHLRNEVSGQPVPVQAQPSRLFTYMLVAAALAAGLGLGALAMSSRITPHAEAPMFELPAPGMAALEAFTCPVGTIKRLQLRGQEDAFARTGAEPSRLSEGLRRFPVHTRRFEQRGQYGGSRDYDEMGEAKHLYDSFDLDAGLVEGWLVMGLLDSAIGARDGIGLYITEVWDGLDTLAERNAVTGARPISALQEVVRRGEYSVRGARLSEMTTPDFREDASEVTRKFFDVVDAALPQRPEVELGVVVGDDASVDFLGLATCHARKEPYGMSWSSSHLFRDLTGLNLMSCNFDLTQEHCDAMAGDTPCSAQLPLACYRDGARQPPTGIPVAQLRIEANFSGGEIRLTKPVAGEDLATRDDANAHCARSFGEGWSVLDHHVAGGDLALTHSDLPHGARAWVDIRTSPNATCWADG